MGRFAFEKPWTPGDISESEGEHLLDYHKSRGGLLFTEVNVAYPVTGSRQRRLDGVLFPNPPDEFDTDAYHYTSDNRSSIKSLIGTRVAELIEVHSWGFYGFGQIVGKSRIVEREWDPHDIRRVFIPDNNVRNPYYPNEKPDPATESVFDDFDITVEVVR